MIATACATSTTNTTNTTSNLVEGPEPRLDEIRILIVDDTARNTEPLGSYLGNRGYSVLVLPDEDATLRAAAHARPHLVILDIRRPGTDPFEVCARLSSDVRLKSVPILIVSTLAKPGEKLRAFRAGALDCINAPFQPEEVEARVRSHVELARQRRELHAQYDQLLAAERHRESLTHMLVHDLRSPLAGIRCVMESARCALARIDPDMDEILALGLDTLSSMERMTTDILDIRRFEAGRMPLRCVTADIVTLAASAIKSLSSLPGSNRLQFAHPASVLVTHDPDILRRVFQNLLVNALQFSPVDGAVRLSIDLEEASVRVTVSDHGPGIPLEAQQRLFQEFGQVHDGTRRGGTGLGLAFCKLAVEAHGGTIGVSSAHHRGSSFWFTLPCRL